MPDLYCNIDYNSRTETFRVDTNIKPELVEDFIADWVIRGQMGREADNSKAKKRTVYHVRINCDLSYDTITITSDTGNKGLTTGIIMEAVRAGAFKPSILEKRAG